MSLTGQLRDGPLGRWCAATLTGTAAVTADVATQLAAARPPIRPGRRSVAPRTPARRAQLHEFLDNRTGR